MRRGRERRAPRAKDRIHQNRYAFVLRLDPYGLIREAREYCDTQHAFDVYELPL
ncbi:hypothetical protein GCM10009796_15450 [Microbacterium koreense]